MLQYIPLATTIFVGLTALVILARWRLPPAPAEPRTAKELIAAWWDERRFFVGLSTTCLFAFAFESTLDAFALALALSAWTFNEHRRMLQSAGYGSTVASAAMIVAGIGATLIIGATFVSTADGEDLCFWLLVVTTFALGFNLTRHGGNYAKDASRNSVGFLAILIQAVLHTGGAPTLDDAVHSFGDAGSRNARVAEHLLAADIEFDRTAAEKSLRAGPDGLDELVLLGWETPDDVEEWRAHRQLMSPRPTNLRLLARYGAPDVSADMIIERALEHVDDTDDTRWFARAAAAVDVLVALDATNALDRYARDIHPGIVARATERPLIDATFFLDTPAEAEGARTDFSAPSRGYFREPLHDAVALMRVVGVPAELDIASIARGAHHIRGDKVRTYIPAMAAHAELSAWPEAELELPRKIINHRATLAALLVVLITLIGGFTAPASTEFD